MFLSLHWYWKIKVLLSSFVYCEEIRAVCFFERCVAIKIAVFVMFPEQNLSTESVKSSPLSFQSIDDVHSCDSLSLGVFSVSDSISNDIF